MVLSAGFAGPAIYIQVTLLRLWFPSYLTLNLVVAWRVLSGSPWDSHQTGARRPPALPFSASSIGWHQLLEQAELSFISLGPVVWRFMQSFSRKWNSGPHKEWRPHIWQLSWLSTASPVYQSIQRVSLFLPSHYAPLSTQGTCLNWPRAAWSSSKYGS